MDVRPPPPSVDHPNSPYDWLLLAVVTAFAIPFILANCAIILHRKKNYFRALGGVDLVVGTSAAGIVWIGASFMTNQHFSRRGILNICPLWTFWLQISLGACLWLMLILLRLHRLYTLCVKNENESTRQLRTWLFHLPLLLLPSIVFSLIATVFRASDHTSHDKNYKDCDILHGWKYATYITVPPLYISLLFALLFWLRRQTDFLLMSEHRHTGESTVMAFVIYLLDAVVLISEKQKNVAGRCFLTFCVCFLVFMDFWVRMGWPVFFCIFKTESDMKEYEDELRWRGAGFFGKVIFAEALRYTNRSISIPSSQLHDGDWILRAMDILLSENAECKERINLLEQQRSRLSLKIRELEESLALLG